MGHRLGILIAMCALMSCSDPLGPGQPSRYANSYFPLALGNMWYYNWYHAGQPIDSSQYDELRETLSKRYLGRMEFFLIRRTRFDTEGAIRSVDSAHYGLVNDTLFVVQTNRPFAVSSIGIYRIFPPTFSDAFDFGDGYQGSVAVSNDSVVVYNCWKPHQVDSGWFESYKKGVGMTDQHSSWGLGSVLVKHRIEF